MNLSKLLKYGIRGQWRRRRRRRNCQHMSISINISIPPPPPPPLLLLRLRLYQHRNRPPSVSQHDVAEDSKGRPVSPGATARLSLRPGDDPPSAAQRRNMRTGEQDPAYAHRQPRPPLPSMHGDGISCFGHSRWGRGPRTRMAGGPGPWSFWRSEASPYKAMSACHACPAHLYRRLATTTPLYSALSLNSYLPAV